MSYYSDLLDPEILRARVKAARKVVRELAPTCLVATGTSGCLAASALSMATRIPIVVVRKKGDTDNHSLSSLEAHCNYIYRRILARWLLVDDFVSKGDTFRRVCADLKFRGGECLGVLTLQYRPPYNKDTVEYAGRLFPIFTDHIPEAVEWKQLQQLQKSHSPFATPENLPTCGTSGSTAMEISPKSEQPTYTATLSGHAHPQSFPTETASISMNTISEPMPAGFTAPIPAHAVEPTSHNRNETHCTTTA